MAETSTTSPVRPARSEHLRAHACVVQCTPSHPHTHTHKHVPTFPSSSGTCHPLLQTRLAELEPQLEALQLEVHSLHAMQVSHWLRGPGWLAGWAFGGGVAGLFNWLAGGGGQVVDWLVGWSSLGHLVS